MLVTPEQVFSLNIRRLPPPPDSVSNTGEITTWKKKRTTSAALLDSLSGSLKYKRLVNLREENKVKWMTYIMIEKWESQIKLALCC